MAYLLNEPWLLGLVVAIFLAATIELGRRTVAYAQNGKSLEFVVVSQAAASAPTASPASSAPNH